MNQPNKHSFSKLLVVNILIFLAAAGVDSGQELNIKLASVPFLSVPPWTKAGEKKFVHKKMVSKEKQKDR